MIKNPSLKVFGLLSVVTLTLADINIVTRLEWNAKEAANSLTPLKLPVDRVIIAHTASNTCDTKETCAAEVLKIQNMHILKNFHDISYNYLIGNDGNIYEGRGSDYQGAVAKGYNEGSLGVAFIGNFVQQLPSKTALEAAKLLFEKLVGMEKLKEDYKIYAHNQLSATISPGYALTNEIKTWSNWSNTI